MNSSPRQFRVKDSKTVMLTRTAVRKAMQKANIINSGKFVMVGLSGGADSLALAAALAWVADRGGFSAGAIIVNHNLQEGSRQVAETAAQQAKNLGLNPVIIKDVIVPESSEAGGPENAAREARYAAFEEVLDLTGASYILTAHTKNDNAEQVLISLARGSGLRSLAGIRETRDYIIRPFVTSVGRAETEKACADQNISVWNDPQNKDNIYTRVRVRKNVLPVLQEQLGDSVVDSLNRTAMLANEDADAFDWMVQRLIKDIHIVESNQGETLTVSVDSLSEFPVGILNRVIRHISEKLIKDVLSREHTVEIARLITDWHGQKNITAAGVTVKRANKELIFTKN